MVLVKNVGTPSNQREVMGCASEMQILRNQFFLDNSAALGWAMTIKQDFGKIIDVPRHLTPTLYNLVNTKEVKVNDVWIGQGDEGAKEAKFSRQFRDWEWETVNSFMAC